MLKMVVKRGFYDRVADQYRPTGELFVVDEKRASELVVAGVAAVLETAAEPALPAEPSKAEKSKRKKKG